MEEKSSLRAVAFCAVVFSTVAVTACLITYASLSFPLLNMQQVASGCSLMVAKNGWGRVRGDNYRKLPLYRPKMSRPPPLLGEGFKNLLIFGGAHVCLLEILVDSGSQWSSTTCRPCKRRCRERSSTANRDRETCGRRWWKWPLSQDPRMPSTCFFELLVRSRLNAALVNKDPLDLMDHQVPFL